MRLPDVAFEDDLRVRVYVHKGRDRSPYFVGRIRKHGEPYIFDPADAEYLWISAEEMKQIQAKLDYMNSGISNETP